MTTFAAVMFKAGSKLYSVLYFKCPSCHKGDLFVNQNPYSFKNFFDMPKVCSNCGLHYEKEPGFFYGAMFVSYGLSIVLAGFTWFFLTLAGFDFWSVIWTVIPVLIVAIPLTFKLSRVIWLNLFHHYNKELE